MGNRPVSGQGVRGIQTAEEWPELDIAAGIERSGLGV